MMMVMRNVSLKVELVEVTVGGQKRREAGSGTNDLSLRIVMGNV